MPDLRRDAVGLDEVTRKETERLTVLVEREPEEDRYAQYGKQSRHALLDLRSHRFAFFLGIFLYLRSLFLSRLREHLLCCQEDAERQYHCSYRSDEGVVNTLIEYMQIVRAECGLVGDDIAVVEHRLRGLHKLLRQVYYLTLFVGVYQGVAQEPVTQLRHIGAVEEIVRLQPPLTQQRSYERSNQSADIDEYIEDLET